MRMHVTYTGVEILKINMKVNQMLICSDMDQSHPKGLY